jgi:hypothetical protein
MKTLGTKALAAAALCFVGAAHAQEAPSWRFSGYGTVGAVATDTDQFQYRSGINQSHGADKTPDFGVDSRLGAQLDYQLNPTFSAVAQVLAARRNGSEGPKVEWLFGQAKVTNELAARVGRMVLPVFLFSDTRNVGYAQHWLRAPSEVYATYPSSSFDGAQLQWRPTWNGVNFTAQVSAGKAVARLYTFGMDAYLKLNSLRSVNLMAESGNWTFRLGGTTTKGMLTAEPVGALSNTRDNFMGAGVQFDDGVWLVVSEYTVRRQGDNGADSDGAYVSGGRRFDSLLPYATLAAFKPRGPFYGNAPTGVTTAVGVRWDVRQNVALKTQFESVIPSANAYVPGQAARSSDRFRTLSIAADFVF